MSCYKKKIIKLKKYRTASIYRETNETKIRVYINLDGKGNLNTNCGIEFLEHMLDQLTNNGQIDITIKTKVYTPIDNHHTVEDIGIAIGKAFQKALGNKIGIKRYGFAYIPMDESLSRVVIDFSGRPSLYMKNLNYKNLVNFDFQNFREFFQAWVNNSKSTLHIDNLKGYNSHHQIESIFKAFGVAIRMAISLDGRIKNKLYSTKGSL
ncbi:imidazoleglycerol-phosphate dehydratase HisB [Candidatus Portiera aleyrodidarum]|uniref:Imidazoleglycerol-phosphate dehydratase n=1 Tax=Candidatus Portiera aleyrodidarum TaxID=91844 RepID=A0A8D9NB27_9GAMM|nr:imidazoleglycerol-phosphate dehydratase HisB [Candidatus Portiera aleyrodidarum]CEI58876.1 Imidazoleglycerol-phosphate dehydratase [Candidatus Portiera aleyrodidarum]